MKKQDYKNFETIAVNYDLATNCGGTIQIKHIEYDINDYIYFMYRDKIYKSKIYTYINGGLYFRFYNNRTE